MEGNFATKRWYFYTKTHGVVPHNTGSLFEIHLRQFRFYVCLRSVPIYPPCTDLGSSFAVSWIEQGEWTWGVVNSRMFGGVKFYWASVITLISAEGYGCEMIPIPRNPRRNFATPTCYRW